MEFKGFPKIARLNREIIVTEKIDGTNAQITITDDGEFWVGSRTRFINPETDNFGFARWAYENKEELLKLGVGSHYGEWWGQGIRRNYGLKEKRFSLFNVARWNDERPECCGVVPILYQGKFSTDEINKCIENLRINGSMAQPGFMNPEGVIVYHTASRTSFKATLKNDEIPKSLIRRA